METTFYSGLEYAKLCNKETLEQLPFKWGEDNIYPGHQFKQLGSKKRSSIALQKADLIYRGRIKGELFFSIKPKNGADSSTEGWYLRISHVNHTCLLMQSSANGFWDIRY